MVLLQTLVEVSKRVSSTTKRKEKVSHLAHLLRQARDKEIGLSAFYLSGQLPQGRLGIGWTALQEALRDLPEKFRPLGPIEIDQLFEAIAREKGPGSAERKEKILRDLFLLTPRDEREFLIRLIMILTTGGCYFVCFPPPGVRAHSF
jgi:DNA ligase-1